MLVRVRPERGRPPVAVGRCTYAQSTDALERRAALLEAGEIADRDALRREALITAMKRMQAGTNACDNAPSAAESSMGGRFGRNAK